VSRRILSAFLALVLVAGFAAVTKADVTGSFDIHITMTPMGTQTEAVEFFFDIQSNLQINVTLSGLTVSADIGFGTTGVEFAILGVSTSLGALQVDDDFVYASPFGCTTFIGGQCEGQNVFVMGDGDGDGVVDGAVGFVKKRIELELNIAGITINNLALFEDVDFPDIHGGAGLPHEDDHFTVPGTPYFLNGTDGIVDNQTPTFGFGDVITLSGQTVSGITVTGRTAFCADNFNSIKKRSWPWEVNEACTSQFGQDTTPLEGGAKTPLLFEREDLIISGVEIGGISFTVSTTFRPLQPITSVIFASFQILDLANVTVILTSDNITDLGLSLIQTTVSSGNLNVTLRDFGGDLTIDSVSFTLALTINQNQNPADLVISIRTGANGLERAVFALGLSRGVLSLDSSTVFAGSGDLSWVGTSLAISVDQGIGFVITAETSFSPGGMGAVEVNLGFTF
jgi:hypothetical protein